MNRIGDRGSASVAKIPAPVRDAAAGGNGQISELRLGILAGGCVLEHRNRFRIHRHLDGRVFLALSVVGHEQCNRIDTGGGEHMHRIRIRRGIVGAAGRIVKVPEIRGNGSCCG